MKKRSMWLKWQPVLSAFVTSKLTSCYVINIGHHLPPIWTSQNGEKFIFICLLRWNQINGTSNLFFSAKSILESDVSADTKEDNEQNLQRVPQMRRLRRDILICGLMPASPYLPCAFHTCPPVLVTSSLKLLAGAHVGSFFDLIPRFNLAREDS